MRDRLLRFGQEVLLKIAAGDGDLEPDADSMPGGWRVQFIVAPCFGGCLFGQYGIGNGREYVVSGLVETLRQRLSGERNGDGDGATTQSDGHDGSDGDWAIAHGAGHIVRAHDFERILPLFDDGAADERGAFGDDRAKAGSDVFRL